MKWCVLAAAVLFASGPLWSSFDGFEAGDFPDPQVDPVIQPPGWAFSIWVVIYLWLLINAIAGVTVRADAQSWKAHRLPLFLSLAVGAVWLPMSQASPVAATVMIWFMLLSGLAALVRTPSTDRWLLRAPVALYAGWLTTAASISLGIVGPGFNFAFSDMTWALVTFAVAVFVATCVHLTLGSCPEYAAPILWGLTAIIVGAIGQNSFVVALAALSFALVTFLVISAPRLRKAFRAPATDEY